MCNITEIFFLIPTEPAKGGSAKEQPCAAINLGECKIHARYLDLT